MDLKTCVLDQEIVLFKSLNVNCPRCPFQSLDVYVVFRLSCELCALLEERRALNRSQLGLTGIKLIHACVRVTALNE
jgi:hypothetical protein